MKARSMCVSGLLKTIAMSGMLFLAMSMTSTANAAGGCGEGYHPAIYNGTCVPNHPGPFATPAPYHPGCWRNMWGQLRCY